MLEAFKKFVSTRIAIESGVLEELTACFRPKILKRRTIIQKQDEVCRHLGFIVKGYVRLYFLKDGEEITKDFNFENSFCGSYASLSLQVPSRFNIVAMEELHVLFISRDDLFRMYLKHPAIERLGRMSIETMFIKKELRESSFLLDTAEQRYKDMLQQYPGIELRVPLKYLASYLGITPETLSRLRRGEVS